MSERFRHRESPEFSEQERQIAHELTQHETVAWKRLLGPNNAERITMPSFPKPLAEVLTKYPSVEEFETQTRFVVRGIPNFGQVFPDLSDLLEGVMQKSVKTGEALRTLSAWAPQVKWPDRAYWDWLSRPEGGAGWKATEASRSNTREGRGVPKSWFVAKWILFDSSDRRDQPSSNDRIAGLLPAGCNRWDLPYENDEAAMDVLRLRDVVQTQFVDAEIGLSNDQAVAYVPTAFEWNILANRFSPEQQRGLSATEGWEWTRTPWQLSRADAQNVVAGNVFGGGIRAVTHMSRSHPDHPAGPRFAIDCTEYKTTHRWPYPLF